VNILIQTAVGKIGDPDCSESVRDTANQIAPCIQTGLGSATASVSDTFRQTLDRLGIDDYVLRERMILIHAPGTRFPTTKLDVLVVSPLGVFVVTAMQLQGHVTPGPDAETLSVVNEAREAMVYTSPLRRHAAAARCLRALLSQHACPVESLAVAANHPCVLHPLLPESILEADELYHYLRLHTIRFFSSRQRHVSVARVVDAIESRSDSRPEAFDEHCARTIALRPR
jgi:Nuclease-related domain